MKRIVPLAGHPRLCQAFSKEKKMGLFRKAIRDEFVIVAVSSGLTMDVDNSAVMVSTIKQSKPSYWELLNPNGYQVFFRSRESDARRRAEMLLSKIQDLILQDDRFADFKAGLSEGELVTEVDWRGRICFPPMGGVSQRGSQEPEGQEGTAEQWRRPDSLKLAGHAERSA